MDKYTDKEIDEMHREAQERYTDEEIRTMYRNAANKNQMLRSILPELTLLKPKRLKEIIFGNGAKEEPLVSLKDPEPKPKGLRPDEKYEPPTIIHEEKKPKHYRWYVSAKDYQTVEDLCAQGLSEAEIGTKLDYTEAAVKTAIKEIKRKKTSAKGRGMSGKEEEEPEIKRVIITEDLKKKICEMRKAGNKAAEIVKNLDISESTVWKVLKEAGLTASSNGTQAKQIEKPKEERGFMKQAKKYFCELCGKPFESKDEAEECTSRHVDLSGYEAEQVYSSDKDAPYKIVFKNADGTTITYFTEMEI